MCERTDFVSDCETNAELQILKGCSFEKVVNFILEVVRVLGDKEMYDFCRGKELIAK